MKLPVLVLAIVIVLILSFLAFNYFLPKNPKAEINGQVFSLYLARSSQEQATGLAKYTKIEQNQGMLFLFKRTDNYSFWMKDMRFPIDIIFIRGDRVVTVFQNVPVSPNNNLPVYTTKTKADKVLEINAGLAEKYNIKIGTEVRISL
jgi:uncharacterized membrane protein (UPF0127 family)